MILYYMSYYIPEKLRKKLPNELWDKIVNYLPQEEIVYGPNIMKVYPNYVSESFNSHYRKKRIQDLIQTTEYYQGLADGIIDYHEPVAHATYITPLEKDIKINRNIRKKSAGTQTNPLRFGDPLSNLGEAARRI